MNLFVDMDGVLADFAQHHQAVFGWRPEREDNVDWTAVREVEDFYLNIPPMADLHLKGCHPVAVAQQPRIHGAPIIASRRGKVRGRFTTNDPEPSRLSPLESA